MESSQGQNTRALPGSRPYTNFLPQSLPSDICRAGGVARELKGPYTEGILHIGGTRTVVGDSNCRSQSD